jgi:hypothetical protein
VSELGNLMADILLSPWRMSTVKIRAGSLFHNSASRIGAGRAAFGGMRSSERAMRGQSRLPERFSKLMQFSSGLHSRFHRCTACTQACSASRLQESSTWVHSQNTANLSSNNFSRYY